MLYVLWRGTIFFRPKNSIREVDFALVRVTQCTYNNNNKVMRTSFFLSSLGSAVCCVCFIHDWMSKATITQSSSSKKSWRNTCQLLLMERDDYFQGSAEEEIIIAATDQQQPNNLPSFVVHLFSPKNFSSFSFFLCASVRVCGNILVCMYRISVYVCIPKDDSTTFLLVKGEKPYWKRRIKAESLSAFFPPHFFHIFFLSTEKIFHA